MFKAVHFWLMAAVLIMSNVMQIALPRQTAFVHILKVTVMVLRARKTGVMMILIV